MEKLENKGMKNILFIIAFIIYSTLSLYSQDYRNFENDIIIYRVEYGEYTYKRVEAIMLVKDSLFYFPNDSMLMTYKQIPYKGIPFNNAELKERLKRIDYSNFNIKNFSDCKAISKNEYIIKFLNNSNSKDLIITERFGCSENSKYKVIELLKNAFEVMHKTDSVPNVAK